MFIGWGVCISNSKKTDLVAFSWSVLRDIMLCWCCVQNQTEDTTARCENVFMEHVCEWDKCVGVFTDCVCIFGLSTWVCSCDV